MLKIIRNFIEIVLAFCGGVFSFIIYAPLTQFLFSYTYKYTNVIYEFLKNIPCDQGACRLRLLASLSAFIIRDTLFALPVLFVFGLLLGLMIKNFRMSRPFILCFGFFAAQIIHNILNAEVSDLPFYVEIARSVPIILLFVYFTKLGCSIKRKGEFRKIGKAIQSEEEE